MGITVNTNIPSLTAQHSLTKATNGMAKAMERMTTGYKINRAADDAAGLWIANSFNTQIRGSKVAQNNIQQGINMLATAEGYIASTEENVNRIRDLAVQAANGTYSDDSLKAMQTEVVQLLAEIDQVAESAQFNGKKLLDGNTGTMVLQVGPNEPVAENQVDISDAFKELSTSVLTVDDVDLEAAGGGTAAILLCDHALGEISLQRSDIGAFQNRLESKFDTLATAIENYSASKSTIMDADIAVESSNYIQQQILQQASASLLATANQSPSIALSLI